MLACLGCGEETEVGAVPFDRLTLTMRGNLGLDSTGQYRVALDTVDDSAWIEAFAGGDSVYHWYLASGELWLSFTGAQIALGSIAFGDIRLSVANDGFTPSGFMRGATLESASYGTANPRTSDCSPDHCILEIVKWPTFTLTTGPKDARSTYSWLEPAENEPIKREILYYEGIDAPRVHLYVELARDP